MKTFNTSPNFSIVMQGGCNAACEFCFNKQHSNKKQCSKAQYLKNLNLALKSLPNTFFQISITGNEPMLSPVIDDVLDICRKGKDIRYRGSLVDALKE